MGYETSRGIERPTAKTDRGNLSARIKKVFLNKINTIYLI
jgi:hypothetical protein